MINWPSKLAISISTWKNNPNWPFNKECSKQLICKKRKSTKVNDSYSKPFQTVLPSIEIQKLKEEQKQVQMQADNLKRQADEREKHFHKKYQK